MNRNSLPRFASVVLFAAIALIPGPSTAYAHVGVSPVHDLMHGLEHPLIGIDHICAMIAVGLWAAQRGGRAIWLVPLTFVLVMTLGGALGMSGLAIPFVEQGIVLSVVVLGVFVAAAVHLPLPISACIVGLFALVHGYAHARKSRLRHPAFPTPWASPRQPPCSTRSELASACSCNGPTRASSCVSPVSPSLHVGCTF